MTLRELIKELEYMETQFGHEIPVAILEPVHGQAMGTIEVWMDDSLFGVDGYPTVILEGAE